MIDHAALVQACAAGDRGALRTLFEAEGPRLLGLAHRLLGRRDLAEEALQETFVRIWRKADRFDPARGSARAWITAILRNHALDLLRDGARETATPEQDLEGLRERDALETAWAGLDETSALRRCLAELDETKRVCVLMAYVLGYTHGEIAGRLRAPLGSTKAWVRRGLASLRECLS